MKKINILAIALIALSLVFTGCSKDEKDKENQDLGGQKNEENIENENENEKKEDKVKNVTEGKLAKKFTDIMSSDKFMMHHKSTSEFDGKTHEMEIITAKSGDKTYTTTKSDLSDSEKTFIIKGDKTYMIDHDAKTVMVLPQGGAISGMDEVGETFEEQELETDGMMFLKSGKEEFKGKTYDYEEYSVDNGSIKYYFDKKNLVGLEMTMEEGKSTWEIVELSDKVDESLFEIPSEYELIDLGM